MYRVAIQRKFAARHYLTGSDRVAENQLHTHQYRLEAMVSGTELDHHGFLIDMDDLSSRLDKILSCYRDQILNDLQPFAGLNPSIENLSGVIARDLLNEGVWPQASMLRIKIWENEEAWASYDEGYT
ncbi:MAG: 6-carboxytetrahydropterin synthase [Deltaproteobacteria bacterium]|nr:6-carboxytetrahydropterin synthase [Deltaproteobacteria bacterium]